MSVFGEVAEVYDAGRPDYPPKLFDALGDLDRCILLDVGAGTGIASRSLLLRGARVISLDASLAMLAQGMRRVPRLNPLVADGDRLPMRDGVVDVVCFAQSWHWMDATRRVDETARVLRRGGRWAAWWSHAAADGQLWFEQFWQLVEESCPGVLRSQRDTEWGSDIAVSGQFGTLDSLRVRWIRHVDLPTWVLDFRSYSFVATLVDRSRDALVSGVEAIVRRRFPEGQLVIPYETRMWTARRS